MLFFVLVGLPAILGSLPLILRRPAIEFAQPQSDSIIFWSFDTRYKPISSLPSWRDNTQWRSYSAPGLYGNSILCVRSRLVHNNAPSCIFHWPATESFAGSTSFNKSTVLAFVLTGADAVPVAGDGAIFFNCPSTFSFPNPAKFGSAASYQYFARSCTRSFINPASFPIRSNHSSPNNTCCSASVGGACSRS